MVRVIRAESSEHYEAARRLFEEYAASLGFDLDFQDFRTEVTTLPGSYAPPSGSILLAESNHHPVGCVGLRKVDDEVCEMKRLYVIPRERGRGIGRRLATAFIDDARTLGYLRIRLDTVPSMRVARELYASLGFREIEAYRYNPIEGATFMELSLPVRS